MLSPQMALPAAQPANLGERVCGVNDVRLQNRIGVSAMTMATSDDVILVTSSGNNTRSSPDLR